MVVSEFCARISARSARAAAVAIFVAAGGFASSVQAAVCPDVTLRNTFAVIPSLGCYAYGEGELTGVKGPGPGNGNQYDPILSGSTQGGPNGNTINFVSLALSDLILIDKSNTGAGAVPGVLSGDINNGGPTGTITIGSNPALAGYTNFVLALRGLSQDNPTWAAFLVTGPGTYDYVIDTTRGSEGNFYTNLYAQAAVIPLPAAAWLLLGGLGGLGLIARRRRPAVA